jgi:hypothetical protein
VKQEVILCGNDQNQKQSKEILEFQRSEIQVFKEVSMKTVSSGMMPHSLLEMYQYFREHHYLQHQGWQMISSTLTKEAARSSEMLTNF